MKNKGLSFFLIILVISLYLFGLTCSYPYLKENISFDIVRNFLEYGVMYSSFILFNILLWKKTYLRIVSLLLLLLISINLMISLSCFLVYDSGFNIGMTVSIFDTNFAEVWSMASMFFIPTTISIIFFVLQLLLIKRLSKGLKVSKWLVLGSLVWVILPLFFLFKHKYISNKGGGFMIKNIYYHGMDLYGGYKLRNEMESLRSKKVNFHYKKIAAPAEDIIVVIGESAQSAHMSLYGYSRDTTPNMRKEKPNMQLYQHAVSPAGITNLSVPLVLSSIKPEEFKTNYAQVADNIIALANSQHYKTFWYSTQGGAKSITAIASLAREKKWINGYDQELLPLLNGALAQPGKKLIVLHIMGSHPNPCDKYPSEATFYNQNNFIDCYDNSIRYTDQVMGKIFSSLRNRQAALFYFSDHALKIQEPKFIHGDFKESTQVPFFVWNAPALSLKQKETGVVDSLVQTTLLYPLIVRYIGLQPPANYKNKNLKYLKLDLSVVDYGSLK